MPDFDAALDDDIGDEMLRLIFTACHPLLPRQARAALALNRAVAVAMAEGPGAGLAIVDGLMHEPALKNYHLLGSVRSDLLHKLGRHQEARAAFEAAAMLAANKREHDLLLRRAAEAGVAAMSS